jgi:hypothetical protein
MQQKLPNVKSEADLRELTAAGGSRDAEAKLLRKEVVKLLKKLGKERKLQGFVWLLPPRSLLVSSLSACDR